LRVCIAKIVTLIRAKMNHSKIHSFKKSSHTDDSELIDGDLIIRYERREFVGITVRKRDKQVSETI